jgi:PAS domain S-box-containing protein
LPTVPGLSWDDCRLLVESVVDYAIFMLDVDGHVATWNAGAQKIKGYAATEIIGEHFSKFYSAEDRAAGRPERALVRAREDGRFEDEAWRVRKDGTRFWANVVITALCDEDGQLRGYGKVTRDLTAKHDADELARQLLREQAAREAAEAAESRIRESEERYRAAATAAEEASRSKDEFLATVSHELRTPLNAIVGWTTLLKDRNLDPALARPLDVIHRNAQAQVKIVEDILDVSRVITGKFRLDPRPCDLVAIARDAIEVVGPAAAAKRITLHFDPPRAPCLLVADPDRVQQVVWNLLSNAVKFTESGGDVRLTLAQESSSIELSVSDTGKGIAPNFLPHVFERFKQADSTFARSAGGLGLGLSLVRHIVELHGGRVSATSEGISKGSTFSIVLPIRAALPPRPVAGGGEATPSLLSGVSVLVIDDEPDARDLLLAVLERAGAAVSTAGSAREAWDTFVRLRPDVVVSDIGMPEEDGFSLIKRVRALSLADGGRTPVIALSAFATAEAESRALGAGFTRHLGKPVDIDALTSAVAAAARMAPSK